MTTENAHERRLVFGHVGEERWRICKECRSPFKLTVRKGRAPEFCSIKCKRTARTRAVKKWRMFREKPRSRATPGRPVRRSVSARYAVGDRVDGVCRVCGKRWRYTVAVGGRPFYCSDACRREASTRRKRKERAA